MNITSKYKIGDIVYTIDINKENKQIIINKNIIDSIVYDENGLLYMMHDYNEYAESIVYNREEIIEQLGLNLANLD